MTDQQTVDWASSTRKTAEDASILLNYLARQGAEDVDYAAHTGVIQAGISGKLTPEDEAKLAITYAKLAAKAKPATAESIRDSKYIQNIHPELTKSDDGGRSTRWILITAIIAGLLTLIVGLYISFTDSVSSEADRLLVEHNLLSIGQTAGTRLAGLTPIQAPSTAPDAKETESSAQSKPAAAIAPTGMIDAAKTAIRQEMRSDFIVLSVTSMGLGPYTDRAVVSSESRQTIFDRVGINAQRYINTVLSNYILPVLAAILGVCVFILRDNSIRIESVSLSPLQTITYWPRFALGIIGGIVIGWFAGEDSSGVFGRISPAAGAFVIGYSTEILFNILDAMKQALGAKSATQ